MIRTAFQQSGLPVGQPADRYKEPVFHFQRNGFDDYFVVQRVGGKRSKKFDAPSTASAEPGKAQQDQVVEWLMNLP